MNNAISSVAKAILIALCVPLTCAQANTERAVTMADIEALEAQLKALKARFERQNPTAAQTTQNAKPTTNTAAAADAKAASSANSAKPAPTEEKRKLDVYATMRPTYGRLETNGKDNWDVRDALSHAGLKVTHEFDKDWSAELHGEWSIDVANEGNFGRSRRAYTALNTPVGRFGIGKQRPAQYLFIAEYVDIFNHANSPFAYDPESLFFVDNLISYRLTPGPFTFVAVAQFNGESGSNSDDLVNVGLSYDANDLHAAVTYQQNDVYADDVQLGDNSLWATSLAYQFTPRFYAAVAYQDKDYNRDAAGADRSGHTFDLSFAYQLAKAYKLKAGYFDFDDGYLDSDPAAGGFDGYNLTLEWSPIKVLRIHLEYLNKSFVNGDDFDSISIGFRYDYKTTVEY
ncbi:porin [Pseudoalteromonas rubra]|uniref:Porin n=1 Tax=Pseudoalteromonas rubra TaxID=43658 RepID=A0A5S3V2L0_9GAMM|nr:porin [Pseudoalteromonas rubra]QPB82891.1 porin [Pseudoalteromonas rubra]